MKTPLPARYLVIAALAALARPGRIGPPPGAPLARTRSASTVASLAPGVWSSRGPGGGGALFSPAISPFNPDEAFLMTDMTGVFHTTDFGDHWETLDFRQIQGDALGRVELTSDPRTLYALSAVGNVLGLEKSVDAGRTFQPIPASGRVDGARYLFASPTRSDTFVTANETAVYVSRDGGLTVEAVHLCNSGCEIGGAFFDGDAVYLGTSDGLLVSRDAGRNFDVDARPGLPEGERIVSLAGGGGTGESARLFALTYRAAEGSVHSGMTSGDPGAYAGIYRLSLAEGGWARVTRGIDAAAKLGILAMARVDGATVYAGGRDSRTGTPVVYATTTGDEWTLSLRSERNANVDTGWSGYDGDMGWEFGEVALGLAVAPADPKRVVVSDLGFVHVSRDGGASWQAAYVAPADRNSRGRPTPRGLAYATSGIEQTSVWSLAWPAQSTLFASITDIRSARSVDGGESWARSSLDGLTLNTTYHAIVDRETGALYAATSSVHDLYQSTYLQDERIDGGRGAVMVSTNGGESFTLLHDFAHPVVWLGLDPTNTKRLYASVVHSRDGGIYALDLGSPGEATRLPIPPRTSGHPYTFQVLRDGTVVATYSGHRGPSVGGKRGPFSRSSGVFVLRPGASAWDDVSLPAMERWTKDVVVDPHDPTESTWYVAVFDATGGAGGTVDKEDKEDKEDADDGGLYRTRDRGRTWRRMSSERRVESCTPSPTDPSLLFMTTEEDGLFVTKNLGDESPTFRPVREYPFRQPLRVFFDPWDPREVWVTSFGGGMRATRVE